MSPLLQVAKGRKRPQGGVKPFLNIKELQKSPESMTGNIGLFKVDVIIKWPK